MASNRITSPPQSRRCGTGQVIRGTGCGTSENPHVVAASTADPWAIIIGGLIQPLGPGVPVAIFGLLACEAWVQREVEDCNKRGGAPVVASWFSGLPNEAMMIASAVAIGLCPFTVTCNGAAEEVDGPESEGIGGSRPWASP